MEAASNADQSVSDGNPLEGRGSTSTSNKDGDGQVRRGLFIEGLAVRVALGVAFGGLFLGLLVVTDIDRSSTLASVAILAVLVLVNVPYWWLGAQRGFPRSDLFRHQVVDVVLLTIMIHFLGGIRVPYGGLSYAALVLFAAVSESKHAAMLLAAFACLCFTALVLAEATGAVRPVAGMWEHQFTGRAQIVAFATPVAFLFALAWIGGSLADQLKTANASLVEVGARIEEQNRTLERKVKDRTAELARATQEIEDLVHIVSHDLKNVAVAVTETARKLVARESGNLSERGKSYADNVLEDGRTMSRMLEDLLLLFRHTEGAGTRAEWVDVDAVVRQSLRQLQYQVEAKRIEISVGPLPSVFADTQKMRHIFDNLLNNACKYVGDKKPARIDVGGEVNGTTVKFFVRDNGVGMDERQRARIFQLYHRGPVQEVEGAVQDGHGVGLAIVKRIVERYGGNIVVKSAAREGTTFEVTLPRGDGTVT